LALLTLGMLLDLRLPREQLANVAAVLGLRLSVSLAVASAAVALLGGVLSPTALAVVCVALLSPIAMLTMAYAAEFDCDVSLAAMLVNCSNVVSFALLCAVLQISMVAPHALAPAAAAGSFVAAIVAAIGYASTERQRTSTGVATAALAGRTTPRAGRARPLLQHCERAAPLSYTGLRCVERSKLQAVRVPLGGAVGTPSRSRSRVVAFGGKSRLLLRSKSAAAIPVASITRFAMR
jgi:hypothetical protein